MKIQGFEDTLKWYDDNSEQYADGLYKSLPTESIEAFIKELPSDPYVLEAGCGPGRESKLFREKGIKTTGIDMSEGLLAVARKINPSVEFVKGNFLSLPFEANTFDGVWSHASLVHMETIEDVMTALKEFNRVLKPSGILFIKVKAQTGEEKTAVVTDILSNHDRFFRYYKPEEMADMITQTGFEIITDVMREDGHGRPEVQWIEIIAKKA